MCTSVKWDFFIAIFSIMKGVISELTIVLDRSTFLEGGSTKRGWQVSKILIAIH